jgi:hypothetical protein
MAKLLKLKIDLVKTSNEDALDTFIPVVTKSAFMTEFGNRVIERMQERCEVGVDKEGHPFAKYSTSYVKSHEFEVYGKQKSEVNLKLSGDMRAAIEVVDNTAREVVIGFTVQVENDKASGHINGAGHLPVRDFWGLPKKDLKEIMETMLVEYADSGELTLVDVPDVGADTSIEDE